MPGGNPVADGDIEVWEQTVWQAPFGDASH